jgi:hypothetical protein
LCVSLASTDPTLSWWIFGWHEKSKKANLLIGYTCHKHWVMVASISSMVDLCFLLCPGSWSSRHLSYHLSFFFCYENLFCVTGR